MASSTAVSASVASDIPPNEGRFPPLGAILAAIFFAGLWLLIINQLRYQWTVNPLYNYGWFIPFLAGYLLFERWSDRPARATDAPSRLLYLVPALCVLAYFPLRLMQEANPDWSLINWALASLAVALSLFAVHRLGGFSWLWHFAFPVLFFLTAVPWPSAIENDVMQAMMRISAVVTAETLTFFFNIPAIADGNIIRANDKTVGVDEACSGMRSLQTAFMMSLFLGEMYRMSVSRRVLLVAASFLAAIFTNYLRTLYLSYVGLHEGAEALEGAHDPAAYIALGGCLVILVGLAQLLKRADDAPNPEAAAQQSPRNARLTRLSPAFFGAAVAFFIGTELFNELWYRSHEADLTANPAWSPAWPEEARFYKEVEIPEISQSILKYDEGTSARWIGAGGNLYYAYFLRWEPGRTSKHLAGAHTPDICFAAGGLKPVDDERIKPSDVSLQIGDLTLNFRGYLFEQDIGPDVPEALRYSWVYHTIVEDFRSDASYGDLNRSKRIQAVKEGRRNLGQRVLAVSIRGNILHRRQAEEALRAELPKIIAFTGDE